MLHEVRVPAERGRQAEQALVERAPARGLLVPSTAGGGAFVSSSPAAEAHAVDEVALSEAGGAPQVGRVLLYGDPITLPAGRAAKPVANVEHSAKQKTKNIRTNNSQQKSRGKNQRAVPQFAVGGSTQMDAVVLNIAAIN